MSKTWFTLFFLLLYGSASFALPPSSCLENGGSELCAAPTVTEWAYGLCNNDRASMPISATWCGVRGGTWQGNKGCDDFVKDNESNLASRAKLFLSKTNSTDCAIQDSGWGQNINAFNCWSGGPSYTNNYLTRDHRSLHSENCGKTIYAIRNRRVVCPAGSSNAFVDGSKVCLQDYEFTSCGIGNPILPLTGTKVQK